MSSKVQFRPPNFRKFSIPAGQRIEFAGDRKKPVLVLEDGSRFGLHYSELPMMSEVEFRRLMEAEDSE